MIAEQPVTNAGLGEQEPWLCGIGFDFLTKLVHVDPKVVRFVSAPGSPYLAEELAVCEDFPRVLDQYH